MSSATSTAGVIDTPVCCSRDSPIGWCAVHREGRAESRYELQAGDRPIEFCFRTKGEDFLPSALASMTAKYLRELAMGALNAFWQRHVPDLRATAGYPQDARRFRQQIAKAKSQLGIDDHRLWRTRSPDVR